MSEQQSVTALHQLVVDYLLCRRALSLPAVSFDTIINAVGLQDSSETIKQSLYTMCMETEGSPIRRIASFEDESLLFFIPGKFSGFNLFPLLKHLAAAPKHEIANSDLVYLSSQDIGQLNNLVELGLLKTQYRIQSDSSSCYASLPYYTATNKLKQLIQHGDININNVNEWVEKAMTEHQREAELRKQKEDREKNFTPYNEQFDNLGDSLLQTELDIASSASSDSVSKLTEALQHGRITENVIPRKQHNAAMSRFRRQKRLSVDVSQPPQADVNDFKRRLTVYTGK